MICSTGYYNLLENIEKLNVLDLASGGELDPTHV